MQINKELNLVIPIEHDDGTTSYVYSIPVSRSVYEKYYEVIGLTMNKIYTGGFGILAGPGQASLILKDVAKQLNQWDGIEGVERGLIQEIKRLTNIIVLGANGWGPVPLHESVANGTIDERSSSEVENAIVFFTVSWHMNRWEDRRKGPPEKPSLLESALRLWGGQLESSSYSEFCASLPTSTMAETTQLTQGTIPALQVPS